ncbi:MAG: GumC family protein [Cyclobacteriaceae bacterium]
MELQNTKEEFVDIQKALSLLISKWHYFVISVFIICSLALIYLKITPEVYLVQAKLQVKDLGVSDQTVNQNNLIRGLGLLNGNPELEDEIGILSSYNLAEKALSKLNFDASYFEYPSLPFNVGKLLKKEQYASAIKLIPQYENPQLSGVPIVITFPDSLHYHVKVEAEDATLYDIQNNKVIQKQIDFEASQLLSLDAPFISDFLSFKLEIDEAREIEDDKVYEVVINNRSKLAERYVQKMEITPIAEESNIVRISLKGNVVGKEITYLESLLNEYIQSDLDKKNYLGVRTIEFIDRQLSSVVDSLRSAEGNLESFRAYSSIINISTTSENLQEQLQLLEEEQAKLKVQQEYYQYTSDYLRNTETVSDIVAPSSVGDPDPFISKLLAQLADLSQERTQKTYSSSSNSPVLRVLDQKIERTKATIIENFSNKLSTGRIAIMENQKRINQLRRQLDELPSNERNLANIERKYSLNDNIYNYLLQKRAEAGIAIASNQADKSVVDYPRMVGNAPVEPNKLIILGVALLLGFILPIGIIWVQDILNNKVNDQTQLNLGHNTPVLGMIPRSNRKNKNLSKGQPSAAVAEAFRFIRMSIKHRYAAEASSPKVIGITSAQEGDGKSFCASNLAFSFAKSGKKTLLIGADMRQPRLSDYYNLKEFGLAEYLEKGATIREVIQPTHMPELDVINSGKPRSDVENLIENHRMGLLIEELKNYYDIIIVDTPPLGLMADYQSMVHLFTHNLLIVRHNTTNLTVYRAVIKKLPDGIKLGIVLNDADGPVSQQYGMSYGKNSYYNRVNS